MPRPWNGTCHRCGKPSICHIMSVFNTELICPECENAERKDPRYEEARKAEIEACRRGDFNFPGIGRW